MPERFDPARVLLEVALKRLILDEHTPLETKDYESSGPAVEIVVCDCCSSLPSPFTDAAPMYVPWPCAYIQALQAIYPETIEGQE